MPGLLRPARTGGAALLSLCLVTSLAHAQQGTSLAEPLAPLTKLRLGVVQFVPATGEYRRWDALGGDVVVSPQGTILLPALGSIDVGSATPDQLAVEIATRLQAKLGLVDRPDATVEVLEYPPIYLVGAVATPGQYTFRPGMTVLHAVAVGGGAFRGDGKSGTSDLIRLQGDLQRIDNDMLRASARVTRLRAELDGVDLVYAAAFEQSDPRLAEIIAQERAIFDARRNELTRQVASLSELADLYRAELDVLDKKTEAVDAQIAQAEHQLEGIKELVASGASSLARQAEIERVIAGMRADGLDNLIATMRAREGLSECLRNLARLQDDRRSEVSGQLQSEQSGLNALEISETMTLRLLRQANAFVEEDEKAPAGGPSYSIVRQQNGQSVEIAATEQTVLLPGDLLKVSIAVGSAPAPSGDSALATAQR